MIKKIVILGGGSAGWLAAGVIAAECPDLDVTVIESPDVATIGVGEGTWPTMRSTLNKIGLSETVFIKDCFASFKQGSKFVGWKSGSPKDVYHHPFTLPCSGSDANIVAAWNSYCPQVPFSEAVSLQSKISDLGLAPKLITTAEYAGVLNYGYHLDADRLGILLREHCQRSLGVKLISDHVVEVKSTEGGDIAALKTKSKDDVEGDLFIDCSGSRGLLIGHHFGVGLLDQSKYSINNRAIATRIPYIAERPNIASMTLSTAMPAGWIWDIGLSSRRGVGYVYSSAHLDDDHAEGELRFYLKKTTPGLNINDLDFRKLNINASFREKMWFRNCLAVGMSAGFIEPLEASALALVELSAKMLTSEMPMTRATMDVVAQRFNNIFRYRWHRIVEFLKLHYVLSARSDSVYWHDVRSPETIPESLKDLLSLWSHRPPNIHDFGSVEEVFPYASYQYVLYGMGFKVPSGFDRKSDLVNVGIDAIKKNLMLSEKYVNNLPRNFDLLEKIENYGLAKI